MFDFILSVFDGTFRSFLSFFFSLMRGLMFMCAWADSGSVWDRGQRVPGRCASRFVLITIGLF